MPGRAENASALGGLHGPLDVVTEIEVCAPSRGSSNPTRGSSSRHLPQVSLASWNISVRGRPSSLFRAGTDVAYFLRRGCYP